MMTLIEITPVDPDGFVFKKFRRKYGPQFEWAAWDTVYDMSVEHAPTKVAARARAKAQRRAMGEE